MLSLFMTHMFQCKCEEPEAVYRLLRACSQSTLECVPCEKRHRLLSFNRLTDTPLVCLATISVGDVVTRSSITATLASTQKLVSAPGVCH